MAEDAGRRPWERAELLVAFRLYRRTPFGRLHSHNPDILQLAHLLGRTPSAVAMKACNFAAFDPAHASRNVGGLKHGAKADIALWREFEEHSAWIADEAESAYEALVRGSAVGGEVREPALPDGPTESERRVKVRRLQSFFRDAVLLSYGNECAVSGFSIPSLLVASHIIPWSVSEKERANPGNGIALNAIYDRAFDRGFMTFDPALRIVLSPSLESQVGNAFFGDVFRKVEGQTLRMPSRFAPDEEALAYHRDNIFLKGA